MREKETVPLPRNFCNWVSLGMLEIVVDGRQLFFLTTEYDGFVFIHYITSICAVECFRP